MVVVEEECCLCGITYPYYALSRCSMCRRVFCRNCLIYNDEGKVTCLRCAKRRLMPVASRRKYTQLEGYLTRKARYSNFVTLSFRFIEEILGDKLPDSAYINEKWWRNSLNRTPSEAWLTVGWKVERVDLVKKEVSFIKDKPSLLGDKKKRIRRSPISPAFKDLALKRKPKKSLHLSKTKLAKALARYKNIERQRSTQRTFKGKLKRAYRKSFTR